MPRFKEEKIILSNMLNDEAEGSLIVQFEGNGCVWIRDLVTNNKILLGESEFTRLLIVGVRNRSNHNLTDERSE